MNKNDKTAMAITPVKFRRKPFYIDAVQVTDKNIRLVAAWCQAEVRVTKRGNKDGIDEEYVKVRVHRPLNERQTQAFIGDWVLYAGSGYKVFTNKAFTNSFEIVEGVKEDEMLAVERDRDEVAKEIRDAKFAQIELTEKIEELMTTNQQAVLAPVEFKEA